MLPDRCHYWTGDLSVSKFQMNFDMTWAVPFRYRWLFFRMHNRPLVAIGYGDRSDYRPSLVLIANEHAPLNEILAVR
jgi:hypothetical protein